MTEEQAARMIELLNDVLGRLIQIENNTDSAYDLSDVCNRLDDIEKAIKNED